MFPSVSSRIPPRLQGDIGEYSAIGWLIGQGAKVFLPLGHSPDVDMIADFGNRLLRVQVKTSTVCQKGRFDVMVCTRGGNRSWNGIAKYFDSARCDYLFIHVGDGRRWFILSSAVESSTYVRLGGPNMSTTRSILTCRSRISLDCGSVHWPTPGGVPERSKGTRCKRVGSAFAGSNPAPATLASRLGRCLPICAVARRKLSRRRGPFGTFGTIWQDRALHRDKECSQWKRPNPPAS